jgi:hypothetical protein
MNKAWLTIFKSEAGASGSAYALAITKADPKPITETGIGGSSSQFVPLGNWNETERKLSRSGISDKVIADAKAEMDEQPSYRVEVLLTSDQIEQLMAV